jgi:kinesin family protein 4/21/27
MRLTTELRSARPGDQDALAKFNETVEPVIMEYVQLSNIRSSKLTFRYEKVVAALNGQLEELREEIVS